MRALRREIAAHPGVVSLEGFACASVRVLGFAAANGNFLGPPLALGASFERAYVVGIERVFPERLEQMGDRVDCCVLAIRGLPRGFRGSGPVRLLPEHPLTA